MRIIGYGIAMAALLAASSPLAQPPCLFSEGAHVRLRSPLDDPRVLLWHQRARLMDYLVGKWGAYTIALGTSLVEANTNARIESACPLGNRNVIGVRIMDGVHARAFGWVDEHDVRP